MEMRFGVVFPAYGPFCDKKFAENVAVEAERRGIDSFLVWDHYMLPYGTRTFDAYILLSYLAAKTKEIRLGTCVTPLPFRNPAILAKMISTLDILSGGRAIVGVGAGWSRIEFEGYSKWEDADVRVKKTKEALKLMTLLWKGGKVDFSGEFFSARGAVLEPCPIQKPYPPLWFGTTGKVMLKLAAKFGKGWIPIDISPLDYERCARKLEELLPEERRKDFEFGFVDHPASGGILPRRVEAYRNAGCEYYCAVLHRKRSQAKEQLRQIEKSK